MNVLSGSSVASAVAPHQLKEFLSSIEWESKDEVFVDAVIQELADNDITAVSQLCHADAADLTWTASAGKKAFVKKAMMRAATQHVGTGGVAAIPHDG